MTFLDPFSGVIAGLVGGVVVLLLYALKLRRLPLQISSTMLWRRAVRDLHANVPFRRLRASWLLLVHMVIVLLIAGAIGRPTIGGSGARGGRVIIALDVSASMSATDGVDAQGLATTRFAEAVRRATDLIERLTRSGERRCVVVSFGSSARQLSGFTSDRAELLDGLALVEPTDGVAADGGGLESLLRGLVGGESEERRLIVVLTDETLDVSPLEGLAEVRAIRCGGAGVGAGAGGNIGFVSMAARRDEERVDVVRVFARLQSTFAEPKRVIVVARIDEDVVATGEVLLDAARDAGLVSATVEMEIENTSGGVLTLSHTTPDLLSSDDRVGAVLAGAGGAGVLVVAPMSASGEAEADPFLLRVLEAVSAGSVEVVIPAVYEAMASGSGVGRDLVVFDRVSPPAEAPAGVPSVTIGADPPGGLGGVHVVEDGAGDGGGGGRTRAVWWERDHPLLRYVNLDTLVVADSLRLRIPSDAGRWRFREVVRGRDGPLVLLSERDEERHLLLAFGLMRSNWGPDPSFVVFFKNVLDYLTLGEGRLAGRSYTTSEGVRIRRARGVERVRVEGTGGAGGAFEVEVDRSSGSELVSVGMLSRVGLYEITGGAASDRLIAVNLLSERESAVWGRGGAAEGDGGGGVDGRLGVRGVGIQGGMGPLVDEPVEVWHWFVMAALSLLTIEWFAYAWMMRA